LKRFNNFKKFKRQARIYNGNLKYEGEQVDFNRLTFEDAKGLFERIQDKESKCLLKYQERLLGHQLDIFLHAPDARQNESEGLFDKLKL